MEDYRDAAILPLTEFLPISGTVDAIAGNDSSWTSRKRRGQHIDGERVRRETMSQNFSILQSLVPNLLPRATREKIVTDTIQYIQRLKREIERLESLKKLLSPEPLSAWPIFTDCSSSMRPSVDVTICDGGGGGGVVFFGIKSAARRNLAAEIFAVFEKHEAEVLGATVSVEDGQQCRWLGLTVTALVGGDGNKAERIKGDILNL